MQILVVVANIQARILKAEVEKGFMRTAIDHELIGPKVKINFENRTIEASSLGLKSHPGWPSIPKGN